jgi:hypothetical protein
MYKMGGELISESVSDSAIATIVLVGIVGICFTGTMIYSCIQSCRVEDPVRIALIQVTSESAHI